MSVRVPMRTKMRRVLGAIAFLVFLLSVVQTSAAELAGDFSKGRSTLSVVGGTGYAFGGSYIVIGVGASYFLIDGLNLGLNVQWWTSGDPEIVKISPSVEYVFYQVPSISPYIGAFFRESYIQNQSNLGSIGGRAGVLVLVGSHTHFGLGVAYEAYLNCDTSTYSSCSDVYPEVSVAITF